MPRGAANNCALCTATPPDAASLPRKILSECAAAPRRIEEANKIIMNRLRKDRILLSKIRSTKAFQDLDKSVNDKHEADSIMSENNTKIELGIIGDKND